MVADVSNRKTFEKNMTAILPLATLSAATLLAGAALVMAFFRRLPAVAVAFVAMIVAASSDLVAFTSGQYWFWGIAVAIALAIEYMVAAPAVQRARRLYTVGGTLAGAVIGLALGTQAAVIISAAVGAFLGYEAYGMPPAGRRAPGHNSGNINEFDAA